jgi:hypothetical protein
MAEIAGLTLITPSSVAGSGVSLSGAKVTFTGAGDVSVNGCFTADHDNYLVVVRLVASTATALFARLRSSGTDASGSDYDRQNLSASNTSVTGSRNTANNNGVRFHRNGGSYDGSHNYFYGPYLSQPTATRCVNVSSDSGATIEDAANTHSLSNSYDGFTMRNNSGYTVTGSMTIYGLSQ